MFVTRWRMTKGYAAATVLHLLLNGPTLALADVPTFTARDSSTYFEASPNLPEVEANDVSIVDADGISVTFGSNWSKKIRDAIDANCDDAKSSQCRDEVKEVLGVGSAKWGLQSRMLPLLFIAAGVALAGIITELIILSKEEVVELDPVHLKIPQDQNEEMSDWDLSNGKVNVKPTEGDAYEIKLNGDPGPKPSA